MLGRFHRAICPPCNATAARVQRPLGIRVSFIRKPRHRLLFDVGGVVVVAAAEMKFERRRICDDVLGDFSIEMYRQLASIESIIRVARDVNFGSSFNLDSLFYCATRVNRPRIFRESLRNLLKLLAIIEDSLRFFSPASRIRCFLDKKLRNPLASLRNLWGFSQESRESDGVIWESLGFQCSTSQIQVEEIKNLQESLRICKAFLEIMRFLGIPRD